MENIYAIFLDFRLSPATYEVHMPTFRNTLFHLHRRVGMENDWGRECCGICMGKVLARK